MEAGFLKLSRKFFTSDMWKSHREFSECEAYLDILQSVSYDKHGKVSTILIKGKEITFTFGQFPASLSSLQERWNWKSKKRVKCFLDRLVKHGFITVDSSQNVNIISVCELCDISSREERLEVIRAQGGNDEGHKVETMKETAQETDNTLMSNNLQMSRKRFRKQPRAQGGNDEGHKVETNKKNKELKNKEKTSTNVDVKKKAEANASATSSDGDAEAQADGSTFLKIFEHFNEKVDGRAIPQVKSKTKKRICVVNARLSEYGTQAVLDTIDKAAASKFLNGGGNNGFIANFDWIFRPNNFPKIYEGNYDNRDKVFTNRGHPVFEREKLQTAEDVKNKHLQGENSYDKFMVFLATRTPYICEHYVLPTETQYGILLERMDKQTLSHEVRTLENDIAARSKYANLYDTLMERKET